MIFSVENEPFFKAYCETVNTICNALKIQAENDLSNANLYLALRRSSLVIVRAAEKAYNWPKNG